MNIQALVGRLKYRIARCTSEEPGQGIDLLEETKPLFLTGDKTQHDKAPYKTPLFLFSEASLVTSEVDYSISFGLC